MPIAYTANERIRGCDCRTEKRRKTTKCKRTITSILDRFELSTSFIGSIYYVEKFSFNL